MHVLFSDVFEPEMFCLALTLGSNTQQWCLYTVPNHPFTASVLGKGALRNKITFCSGCETLASRALVQAADGASRQGDMSYEFRLLRGQTNLSRSGGRQTVQRNAAEANTDRI